MKYTKKQLYDIAKKNEIVGRSKMTKTELWNAIVEDLQYTLNEEYNVLMEPCHIACYYKNTIEPMIFDYLIDDQEYTHYDELVVKLVKKGEIYEMRKSIYSVKFVEEMRFVFSEILHQSEFELFVHSIPDHPLMIKSEEYYGFIAPRIELEEEED